jgi:asparagine synthase (glutamine-hydrolysing)
MCGLAGVYHFDGRPPDAGLLRRAGDALRHRGPDDEGLFLHEGFGMVHRRLSIIDLSTGQQPIFNEDRTVVTILNGEIYNYRELRETLEARGHAFSTNSDTEVLVHLYEDKRNLDFLALVNGMFAFVIYDVRSRTLWLARDRTGKKPLYYYSDRRQFAFASELQALTGLPDLRLTLCPQAVDAFLRYNYVPSPLSIYREVRKLPPAHALRVAGGQLNATRYWRMPAPHPDGNLSEDAFRAAFHDHLARAVSSRLMSDVPLGAFLSGGLDSSAIVALMCEQSPSPVCTFSVGFGSRSFDESGQASEVARILGTDHQVEMQESLDVGGIDTILGHFGEPFGDSSAIPTYYLCKMARRWVTVALSGDGADEVLGGYNRYVAAQFAARWARLPAPLRLRRPLQWIAALPEGTGYYGDSFTKKVKLLSRFVDRLEENPTSIMPIIIDDAARSSLYSDSFRDAVLQEDGVDPVADVVRDFARLGLTERMLWTDLETYLADDIHVKVDRMSMAHSLEVRCPFLDVRLLEFLATVPVHLKIRGGETKRLLRELVARRLPSVAKRRKHGFEAPIGEWINGDLRERINDLFAGAWAADYFDRTRLREMLEAHRTQSRDLAKPIWAVFVLLQWAQSQRSSPATSRP